MKLRTVDKIAIITSTVLFCAALVVFLFFKLSAAESRHKFILYKLLPPDATAVLDLANTRDFIYEIDELQSSKDQHHPYVSKLLAMFKTNYYTLRGELAHGVSSEMNKMLISFHEPSNDKNQVIYCGLGDGDYSLVEEFLENHFSFITPPKRYSYKGEEMRIYPTADGDFLVCYMKTDFLVVSFQKRLIEKVIDASLSEENLLQNASFSSACTPKRVYGSAVIYARMDMLNGATMNSGEALRDKWLLFNIKMGGRSVFFTGNGYKSDSCQSFTKGLCGQQPIENLLSDSFPSSTLFVSHRSATDWQAVSDFIVKKPTAGLQRSIYLAERDAEIIHYFKEQGVTELTTCIFEQRDSVSSTAAVVKVFVADIPSAELMLKRLIDTAPVNPELAHSASKRKSTVRLHKRLIYTLPPNTFFSQMMGVPWDELHTYACFYHGKILFAPQVKDLISYIDYLEKEEVVDYNEAYADGISGLSNSYNLMCLSDFGNMAIRPENYEGLLPTFFLQHADFFSHFLMSTQISCVDGVVSPHIVLLYKKE